MVSESESILRSSSLLNITLLMNTVYVHVQYMYNYVKIQHSCPVLPRISGEVMIASIHVHVCTSDPRTVLRTDIGYTV